MGELNSGAGDVPAEARETGEASPPVEQTAPPPPEETMSQDEYRQALQENLDREAAEEPGPNQDRPGAGDESGDQQETPDPNGERDESANPETDADTPETNAEQPDDAPVADTPGEEQAASADLTTAETADEPEGAAEGDAERERSDDFSPPEDPLNETRTQGEYRAVLQDHLDQEGEADPSPEDTSASADEPVAQAAEPTPDTVAEAPAPRDVADLKAPQADAHAEMATPAPAQDQEIPEGASQSDLQADQEPQPAHESKPIDGDTNEGRVPEAADESLARPDSEVSEEQKPTDQEGSDDASAQDTSRAEENLAERDASRESRPEFTVGGVPLEQHLDPDRYGDRLPDKPPTGEDLLEGDDDKRSRLDRLTRLTAEKADDTVEGLNKIGDSFGGIGDNRPPTGQPGVRVDARPPADNQQGVGDLAMGLFLIGASVGLAGRKIRERFGEREGSK